ncbi:hypothetical protein FRC08_011073 [Ceratobasidium sp. 394]|nr:hypothetical protein FRC08_011073 [Ceratobasidium sp. 394]
MTSKSSKREKFREFLDDAGHALRRSFRSRSPASSAPGGNSSGTQLPTFVPTDTVALGPPETLQRQTPLVVSNDGVRVSREPSTQLSGPTPGPSVMRATQPLDTPIPNRNVAISSQLPSGTPSSVPRAGNIAPVALKTAFDALGRGVNVIPAFKSVADVIIDCINSIPAAAKNRKDYEDLASSIVATIGLLEEHLNNVNPAQMTKAVRNVIEELSRQADHIGDKQRRTRTERYLDAEQDIDDLMECYRRIETMLKKLQVNAILNVWKITNESLNVANENLRATNENIVNIRLERLHPVNQARYDSSVASQVRRTGCTPNTRQLVLQELQDWANDAQGAKIYWMNGMAGTGKTTIAYSICSQLEASHQLAASFFCSRLLPECRDVSRIVPTIAYQLARFCHPFQNTLCQALGIDPDVGTRGVMTQFERLISGPLLGVNDAVPRGLLVVVIDALDECSDRLDALLVLDTLLRFVQDLPIKFFVTCRPDATLLSKLSSDGGLSRSLYHLHDIEQSLVQADIHTYLHAELDSTRATAGQIRQLAEQSGRLFIYAATAVRYIRGNRRAIDPPRRLNITLGVASEPSGKAYEPLDALYTAVLSAALWDDEVEPWEKAIIELVLHTAICTMEPLTTEALARLLQLESAEQAQMALEPLLSVLHVDPQSGLVSPFHASFPEYMHTAARSGRFFCDKERHSELLARRCFETMGHLLRFNICNLESSFILDENVPGLSNRVSGAIPSHLFYACRYWSDHLVLASDSEVLITFVEEFLRKQVLFWVEAMNLRQSAKAGILVLSRTYEWMKKWNVSDEACVICQDAQKFLSVIVANPVYKSTPHIYVSVLALWDKQQPMWTYYGARIQGPVKAEGPAIENRGSAALAVWRTHRTVVSVAVSSDGRRVASGHTGGSINIWDAHNGDMMIDLIKGHTGYVLSVAFSPDCARIVSGSQDATIRIWDARTGQALVGPLNGHTGDVWSVAYSPNGDRIVSGSADKSIRIWDAYTGRVLAGPFEGHANSVTSTTYSPDGSRIASSSNDGTIRVWDAHTGHILVGPLKGHTSNVGTVKFSPDGHRIASGSSDFTVRIWDAQTGSLQAGPFYGHTDPVRGIAFSPDGKRLVSASQDHTVRVWDVQTGQTVAGPLRGHTGWVYSAVFMPDGTRIVSGSSDFTIRIWDARTRHKQSDLSEGHVGEVHSVGFSYDSSQVVSGSSDCTVCIWDAQTGRKVAGPFKGHTGKVRSVAFSPTGNRVASGSVDRTIRIWDAQSGSTVAGPFEGHIGE